MTIIYDASDNLAVIFKMHGSVWPKVFPMCVFNILLTLGIYWLYHNTEVDLTFAGGIGYGYISVLVSFFTITSLNSTYARFWEARGHLGTAMTESNMLAARAALYTAHDPSDKADAWRATLKDNLIRLIDAALFMIQDNRACIRFNAMDHKIGRVELEKHNLQATTELVHSVSSLHVTLEGGGGAKVAPVMARAMDVDATILTSGDHVEDGCKNAGELHGRSAAIMGAYFNLIKFSTTPRPFVIAQMGRTLVFLWILSLPGAVLNGNPTDIIEGCFLVFIVTYGFIGLTLVDVELTDPLGNDANDLETERYLEIIKVDIEKLLGKDSLSSEGKLLTHAYHVPSV